MQQVAALTPCFQVLEIAVGGVVVEVAGREPDDCPTEPVGFVGAGCLPTALISPGTVLTIEPSAIADAEDEFSVRSAASLAAALGTTEADGGRQLRPVVGVEGTMFGADRHRIGRSLMDSDTDSMRSSRSCNTMLIAMYLPRNAD